jgi:S-methylmethionine-dependent homocysteine/selenocysteine methylase
MGIYSQQLPQLGNRPFITDGGLETVLCFQQHIDLPHFAAYDLLRDQQGYERLYDYYTTYTKLAQQYGVGIVLETPTWRANPDWARLIGDSPETLEQLNRQAVKLLEQIRDEYETEHTTVLISGNLGPRGDGYTPSKLMTEDEAKDYHSTQIATFADTNVDMLAALTLNYVDEAIGITRAAQEHDLPVAISFTVETDGKLPNGESLQRVITEVDAATDQGPAYYMINCAHPTHFEHLFKAGGDWLQRIRGLRGNASCLSHAELDESETLDDGNPVAFGCELEELRRLSSHLTVLGGCCGTDHRHIEEVCKHIVH